MTGLEGLPWKDYLTMTAAIVGAVLGIMNMWNTINQRRVRLIVQPVRTGEIVPYRIEVINLSSFPVTISKVGFCRKGQTRTRYVPINIPIVAGGTFPTRLQPREAVSISFNTREDITGEKEKTINLYAETACGKVAKGSRRTFKRFKTELTS